MSTLETKAVAAAIVALATLIRMEVMLTRLSPSLTAQQPRSPSVRRSPRSTTSRTTGGTGPRNAPVVAIVPLADEPITQEAAEVAENKCGKTVKMPMETGFEWLYCCLEPDHEDAHFDNAFFKCWHD